MLGKITKANVERLQPGQVMWDAGHREVVKGFGARRQTNDVFYVLRYRLGKQRLDTIGRHGSPWTPNLARNEAKRLLGQVAAGIDPRQERERKAETFGAELDRYLEHKRALMKPRAFAEIERHLMTHAKPLHRLALADIDRRTIAQRLAEIETASGPVARNRARSSLSAFFAWLVREGLLEANPVSGTSKAIEAGSRERVLSPAELGHIWRALGEGDFGDIVRLLILTAQRREEIGSLRWSEIDFERGLIRLGPQRTKNKRLHEVPLSPAARSILEVRLPKAEGPTNVAAGRDLVFGHGRGGFSGWSDAKKALDARAGVGPWRLHDVRRTAATVMADRLGVLPHIVEVILNHVSGHRAGVAGVYNRAKHEDEMRLALGRWAEHVEAITSAPGA